MSFKFNPFTGSFDIASPPSWKDPVANFAALPATGNIVGDTRVTKDDGVIYVWIGSAWVSSSGISGIGSAVVGGTYKSVLYVDSSNDLAQDNANFNYDDATKKLTVGGQVSADSLAVTNAISGDSLSLTTPLAATYGGAGPQSGNVYYVDNSRTDSYTATGSFSKPFKTLQAAINAVAASTGRAGTIFMSPGIYSEAITLNNNLASLVIFSNQSIITSISSTTNNDNFIEFYVYDAYISGAVTLTCSTNGNSFLSATGLFQNCTLAGGITSSASGNLYLVNCEEVGNVSLTNVIDFEVRDGQAIIGSLSIDTNFAATASTGFGGINVFIENAVVTGGNLTIDSGSYVQFRKGTRFGSFSGTVTIQNGGELEAYSSYIRSNIVVDSGGTFTSYGTFWAGTVTGSYNNLTYSEAIGYTPDVSSNWSPVPSDVKAALDQVGARSLSLNAVGSSPNSNGASVSGFSLTLQPANGTNPGVLTSGTQTIGGNKTFSGQIFLQDGLVGSPAVAFTNSTTTGLYLPSSNVIGFTTSGTERARLDSTGLKLSSLSNTNRVLISSASGYITESATTSTEIGYVSGVTSGIQSQLDNKQPLNATLTNLASTTSTPSNGQLLIGNGSGYTVANLTAGSGIGISNGAGSITISTTATPSTGDINETSFTALDNQFSAQNVTGLAFANATVRSFEAIVSIVRNTTYAQYKLFAIQKASSWEMNAQYIGDDTGIIFTITNAGQVQYTSSSTGSNATIKFRAFTTTV